MRRDHFDYSKAREITDTFNGKKITGQYVVEQGAVTIRVMGKNGDIREISTHISSTGEHTAWVLLRELAKD